MDRKLLCRRYFRRPGIPSSIGLVLSSDRTGIVFWGIRKLAMELTGDLGNGLWSMDRRHIASILPAMPVSGNPEDDAQARPPFSSPLDIIVI